MQRQAVNSSNVVSVGYDAATKTLEVEFKGGVYQYSDVPAVVHRGLMGSASPGSYLAANIRRSYPYTRVSDR